MSFSSARFPRGPGALHGAGSARHRSRLEATRAETHVAAGAQDRQVWARPISHPEVIPLHFAVGRFSVIATEGRLELCSERLVVF